MRIRVMEWLEILKDVFLAVGRAWQVRLLKKSEATLLPPVASTTTISDLTRDRTAGLVKFLIYCIFFWKPGRCFYRSYAMAYVLRKRGIPMILNLGCKNYSEQNGKAKAHCWLTLEGKPYAEKGDPCTKFFLPMGQIDGQVHYWLGSHINSVSGEKINSA